MHVVGLQYITVPQCTVHYITVPQCSVHYITVPQCTVHYITVPQCTVHYITAPQCTVNYITVPQCTVQKTKVTSSVGATVYAVAVILWSNNIDQGTNKTKLCGRQWYQSSDPWHHCWVVQDVWRCSYTGSHQVGVPDLLTCSWVYDMYRRHLSLVHLSSPQVNCCCFMIIQIYSVCTSFVCLCALYLHAGGKHLQQLFFKHSE